jgi:uncharacterized protein (UPF0262 family)
MSGVKNRFILSLLRYRKVVKDNHMGCDIVTSLFLFSLCEG